jgi:glycosyltransferase involved in cell wall biosynthesis
VLCTVIGQACRHVMRKIAVLVEPRTRCLGAAGCHHQQTLRMPPTTSPPDISVVCVTPVKNEEWILERFLRCAAVWADHIIVLDQCSTDRSREIAAAHPKVRLIVDDDPRYDELRRQRTLLDAARQIPGRRLVIALDADEALSADTLSSPAWAAALRSRPGTVLRFRWANLLPGFARAWIPPHQIPFGFVDDGRDHHGTAIHNTRLPASEDQPSLQLGEHFVLHYQYAAWSRMKSKQRWYQCWECLNQPYKRPIQLYRQYHFMDAIPDHEVRPLDRGWFVRYEADGIDMASVSEQRWYPWDEDVLEWLISHGPRTFARLDVWEPDYRALAEHLRRPANARLTADPRGPGTRLVHAWLARTQHRANKRRIRLAQRALIPLGW